MKKAVSLFILVSLFSAFTCSWAEDDSVVFIRRPTGATAAGGVSYYQTVLNSSPLSYLRLGESSGATAVDEQGNHNGTYTGTIGYSQTGAIIGDANTAIYFGDNGAGIAGQADLGSGAWAEGLASMTIEIWGKTIAGYGSTGQYRSLTSLGNVFGEENGWRISMDENTGKVQCIASKVTDMDTDSGFSTSAINNNAYHQVVCRYDGANLSIWVDGVKESQTALTGNLLSSSSHRNVYINESPVTGLWGFPGTEDEWSFYTTSLSDADILNHYNKGIGL